jgi:hypothetical protein
VVLLALVGINRRLPSNVLDPLVQLLILKEVHQQTIKRTEGGELT